MKNSKFVSLEIENQLEEIRRKLESMISWPVTDQRSEERNGSIPFHGYGRGITQQQNLASFSYHDERASNDPLGSFYGHGEQFKNRNGFDELGKFENLENSRAEIIRQLYELKEQLSGSHSASQYPEERISADRGLAPRLPDLYSRQDTSLPESSTSYHYADMQTPPREVHVFRSPYLDRSHAPIPHGQGNASNIQDFHVPRDVSNEFMQFEDAYQPQVSRRPPYRSPWTYHDHFPGHHMNHNQEPIEPILQDETFLHQPGCSCLRCHNKNWKVSPNVPPPLYQNFYQHRDPVTNGQLDNDSRGLAPAPLHSRGRQLQTRITGDVDLVNGDVEKHQASRLTVGRGSKRVLHPIVGGAPFIACCNCFELLKLPRKVISVEKKQQKILCGACSTIILLVLDSNGLVITDSMQVNQASERDDSSAAEILDKRFQNSHSLDSEAINFRSEAYDDHGPSGYTNESNSLTKDQNSNFRERRQSHLLSSYSSEDEQRPDPVIAQKTVSNSAETQNSPLHEHPDNTLNDGVSREQNGKKSKRTFWGKLFSRQSTSGQDSAKDVEVETDMEVSVNEYLSHGVTQDSIMEVSSEEEEESMTNERSSVYVNGQLIRDRAVKEAEKLAGTIQPGDYWYDIQAGFWGVMGHPCLGIIPPLIKEFSYPMPENCAGGNTGVFVNGRELHQRDLERLSARGLPITKDKSYIIKVSGKVRDAETGEKLYSLGRLAPTVQRERRGFGMKIPKTVAQ